MGKRSVKNIGNSFILAVMAVALLLASCTGRSDNPAESRGTGAGSLAFSLVFEKPNISGNQAQTPNKQIPPSSRTAIIPNSLTGDVCTDYGLSTITGRVLNAANVLIATGGPWLCSAHQGTFSNIPVGSGYTVVFEADVAGTIAWRGQTTNQSIANGQTTTLLPIVMAYIGSDAVDPLVASVTPPDAATNIPVDSEVAATFSEDMLPLTIDTVTFTLIQTQGSAKVAGSVSYDVATRTATFTPSDKLAYFTGYTATVVGGAAGVKDKAAKSMQSNNTWTFTTMAMPATVQLGGAIQKNGSVALNNAESMSAVVSTLAGSAGVTGSTDGTGAAAQFNNPGGITTDGKNLYVADYLNHTIRQVAITTGVVTTLAGSAGVSGSTNGTGPAALFYGPCGITTDGTNLYVVDTFNHAIRQIVIATGVVTTIAGSAGTSGSLDATGTSAQFYMPFGITTDGVNLYVADSYNNTIRQVAITTGLVTTLAGGAGVTGSSDATGTDARFNNPYGITTDGVNLYVADTYNHTIRQVVMATRVVTTLAGSAAGGQGSTDATGVLARFNFPYNITTDGMNLYVSDNSNYTIRKVVRGTGAVTTLAGSAGAPGATDGIGTAARFNNPWGITTDGMNLFVADESTSIIREIRQLGLIPDTGQTTSYTSTFGEDHDYLINPPSYTNNGNGTVTDKVTGLMWQQSDDDISRTWDEAGTYCADLTLAGYTDWRLPDVKGLMDLISCDDSPAINGTYFLGVLGSSDYWSSTAYANNSSQAWVVEFYDGVVNYSNKPNHSYVRCVR